MNGKERTLSALRVAEPDRVPLFIHAINEGPIMGIGRHLTDGLPEGKSLHEMNDAEKMKVIDTLFMILEQFKIDGYTCLPIGAGTEFGDGEKVIDDWGVEFTRTPYGMPVASKHPVRTPADLDNYQCTIEEREEYEPHLDKGIVVYAGVDYEAILRQAETEADLVLWDGGNNDFPFYVPDMHIVIVDPHRPGHEMTYHPGEANLRMADVVVINKIDTADYDNIRTVRQNVQRINPEAVIVEAASPIYVEQPDDIRDKRVLVVEDGPTLTHGEMAYGAGVLAARRFGAAELVDPRPYATGSIRETYRRYGHMGALLPAMGYGAAQVAELEQTIRDTPCDLVLAATPIDLRRVLQVDKPLQRVRYEIQAIGRPNLEDALALLEAG